MYMFSLIYFYFYFILPLLKQKVTKGAIWRESIHRKLPLKKNYSQICMCFPQWNPMENSCLEYSYRFVIPSCKRAFRVLLLELCYTFYHGQDIRGQYPKSWIFIFKSDFDRLLFFRFKTKTDLKEFIFNLIFNFNRGPYAYVKMNQMFLKI